MQTHARAAGHFLYSVKIKAPMIAHILGKSGKNPCPNASEPLRTLGRLLAMRKRARKKKWEREGSGSGSENDREKK